MFSNSGVKTMVSIWFIMTVFISLAILGMIAAINYNNISDLSNETCHSIGGYWVETEDQYICAINREEIE